VKKRLIFVVDSFDLLFYVVFILFACFLCRECILMLACLHEVWLWVVYFFCYLTLLLSIATDYGLDGPGIESRWRRDFPRLSIRPWSPLSLLYNGYRVFPGVNCGRGVLLTTHPLRVPRSWKNKAIPLPTIWACNGFTLPLHQSAFIQFGFLWSTVSMTTYIFVLFYSLIYLPIQH
jgi:hypothetical protein